MSSYKIEAGTAQHIGSRPQQNDRAALYGSARAPGYVMAVLSDGLNGGAIASEQVLHTSKHLFDEFRPGDAPSLERLAELLRNIAEEAHAIIKMNPLVASREAQGTLVLLLLTPAGQAVWAHVGDSRLYRFSNSQCAQRSNDSAYVEHLVRQDGLPPDAAKKHRNSKLLANVLGNRLKDPFISIGSHAPLQAGDAFMLCSDGLWQYFADVELAAVVARNSPRQAAELLINKTTERADGKGDNCTMAIVKLIKPPREVPDYVVQKMGRAV
ncbi:MAG TPA: PP2C family serine/threonine-protein phosphatase [Janthinobacterium sp.]|jgi:serine/threonine protein phosphatase PrpC|nr:PP2C family serine/threonine-protein phosphatase [Janthinobacterium sp.]